MRSKCPLATRSRCRNTGHVVVVWVEARAKPKSVSVSSLSLPCLSARLLHWYIPPSRIVARTVCSCLGRAKGQQGHLIESFSQSPLRSGGTWRRGGGERGWAYQPAGESEWTKVGVCGGQNRRCLAPSPAAHKAAGRVTETHPTPHCSTRSTLFRQEPRHTQSCPMQRA